MPTWKVIAALWNRDTAKRQMGRNQGRLAALTRALEACEQNFARVRVQAGHAFNPITSIFLAPEYFFAADRAGLRIQTGGFHARDVDETEKDQIVADLMALSGRYKRTLLVPGTIAWSKPLDRRGDGDQYKRDLATQQRTGPLKTQPRHEKVDDILAGGFGRGGRIPTARLYNLVRRRLTGDGLGSLTLVKEPDVILAARAIVNDDVQLAILSPTGIDDLYTTVPSSVQSQNALWSGDAQRVIKNTAYVLLNGTVRFKYGKQNDFHEALSDDLATIFCPGSKPGLATIEGIDIGIEICLDHGVDALWRSVQATGSALPLLHLVTSATVSPKLLVVRPGGYYLHASSSPRNASVEHVSGGGVAVVTPFDSKVIEGDPLNFYELSLTVP